MKRDKIDYDGWSREQLINRLVRLEKASEAISRTDEFIKSQKKKKQKEIDFSKYQTRPIALKFAYLGWDYQGLAIQGVPTVLPTVEEKILGALLRVRLVQSRDPQDFEYSRCGRTDKGVSAMNQVISLRVRSKLTKEELEDPANDDKEIDYIKTLNHILPADIRFHSVCLRPPEGFDARFSCQWRQYKYVFNGDGLDVGLMRQTAQEFVGVHDFRNFCKIDGSKQLKNFTREVYEVSIEELEDEPGFYGFNLKGTAFLWHQVRCMMAVLFTVGQGLEQPVIVRHLLSIEEYPGRPAYRMAHDIPLILFDCGYDEGTVKWSSGPARQFVSHAGLNGLANDVKVKAVVTGYMDHMVKARLPEKMEKVVVNLGDGVGKASGKYIPYSNREKVNTPEQINEHWRSRKERRAAEPAQKKPRVL